LSQLSDNTVNSTIGNLLEAAVRDQAAIGKAAARLAKLQTDIDVILAAVPGTVASRVDVSLARAIDGAAGKLVERFDEANVEAERAVQAFRRAAQHPVLHIAWILFGLSCIAAAAIVAVAWTAAPTNSEIQALREERDALKAEIAWLKKNAPKSDIKPCQTSDGKQGICARLDPTNKDEWVGGYRFLAAKRR
jgi:hypothetical protein